ncbi:probable disease resistance protein RXW24L [Brassica napus]|uniref:probable disease resistance protein RXW24L n=1 Tax=Brassica napus TaxID=3708 RepID=UPI0020787B94|nr:probable disease resistance protein RXW24L [Brassica napus]
MAEALLPFAVERLWNLLVRETGRFQGVEEQFEGLKSDVKKLRCFLEDADAKKHKSATVKRTIQAVKEIVLDAEDIVETFVLMEELGNRRGITNTVRRLSCVSLERRGLAMDMKAVRERISKEIHDMQSFGVQQQVIVRERCMPPQDEQRQTFYIVDEEQRIVGMERNIELVVGNLVEEDSRQVFAITGMGGIGKTTLARKVFNHEKIKKHFSGGLAWVCVSQQFEKKTIWQTILQQLWPECDVSKMMEGELLERIVRVLYTQKALIIIDDIWREGDWDLIKHVFLPKKGWKVLLTSRNEEVALHADKHCVTFKPECLTFEESWDLFQRIAFPIKDTAEFKIEKDMKEIGMEMIRHCGGLPLAIKVLGALLGKKYALHEWKRIRENIKAPTVRGSGSDDRNFNLKVYGVLYLSFEELPAYLKQCFLYLASFPEDYEIHTKKLSYYWAAEGILRPMDFDGASIREVVDGYIEELVKRNMVISKRDVDTSRFKTLQLHDMMREVCLRKAEEENFVQTICRSTANSKSPCKSRRLAVVRLPEENFNVDKEVKNPSLRTILFIECIIWKATSLLFTSHKLMRVLDLSEADFEGGKVPSSIGKLIHLRYLSLYETGVTQLPSSMRNLKKLLYLNLAVYGEVHIPNILNEMRELTFLWLPKRLHDKTKLELGNLVKLETLKNFNTKHGRLTDLQGMTRLRSLSISITNESCTTKTLSSSLSKLSRLESLTIDNKNKFYNPTNDDEEGFVWDFVNLKQLWLEIYMPRLPDAQHFPSHLKAIKLTFCRLKEDPMPILEKLLHLKEICLQFRSFSGRRMECSRDGFPQLQKLEFRGLEEWEEWIVKEGSMPLLHTLRIDDCRKLKELPDGLQIITNLEDLIVCNMGDEFNLRLSEGYLPSHLTTISLSGCRLTEDPMPTLEKLLHLKDVSLDYRSFCGRRMVCSRGGFPQLQKLQFKRLEEWEEWIVEEGSMPLLHTLIIYYCPKLKELPDGLRFITSLKCLVFYNIGKRWEKRLSKGGKDYYKVQHIPSVTIL